MRSSQANAQSIETQSSTSTVTNRSISEIITTIDTERLTLDATDICSRPTATMLCADANKEKETDRSKKSSKTTSLRENFLQPLNVTAGNPISASIQIISLVQCSSYLPSTMTQDTHTSHITEKKIDIINIARHCLEKVSSKDLESTIDFQMANLIVAVYCLRSVNTTLASIHASGDATIRKPLDRTAELYFHSISIAEEMAYECYKASQKQDDEFKSASSMFTAVHMCLAAYEGLGHLLKSIWNLPWMSHGNPSILSLFPVPDISWIRRNRHSLQQCAEPFALTDFKNVFRSITSLCTALNTLKRAALKTESSENTREFLAMLSQKGRHLHAECYGEQYLINYYDSHPTPTDPFQIIMSEVLMPWMMTALCFDGFAEAEALKEVSSYCNRGYNILWSAAQDIDCSHSKDNFQKYRLKLREDALLMLLFHQNRAEGTFLESNIISLKLKSLDEVCKLASASSSEYFQSEQGQADDELIRFHLNVGGAIDDIVIGSSAANSVYIDYCARRAFHLSHSSSVINCILKSCSCIFAQLPFPFSHTKDYCVYHGAADHRVKSLALLYITLCLTHNLLDYTIEQIAETFLSDYLSMVDALGGFVAMTLDDLLYIYKLLKIIELSSGSPQRFTSLDPYRLRVLSPIFSQIFIPTVEALMSRADILDSLRSQSTIIPIDLSGELKFSNSSSIRTVERDAMSAAGINLLLKTAYILDKLENFTHSDECIGIVVNWIFKESMITADAGVKLIKFSAKTLSNVGKMRMSQQAGVACIMPFIASVELLVLSFSITRKPDYTISDQYAHLSKLFLSHNMIREATVATALSIRDLVYELSLVTYPSAYDGNDIKIPLCIDENSVRQCPISFSSEWPESFSSRCRALLYKLANLLKAELSTGMYVESFFTDRVPTSTWPRIKVWVDVCGDDNSSLLKNIIRKVFLSDKEQSDKRMFRFLSQVTKIFLWDFIRTFDCCGINEVGIVRDAMDAAIACFENHGDLVSCIELNTIVAVALSPDDKSISYTKSFLCEALRRCQGAQDLGLTYMVYYAQLSFFYLQVLSFDRNPKLLIEQYMNRYLPILTSPLPSKGYDKIVEICNDCLLKLVQDDPSSNETMMNSIITLLTKSYLMLDYEGCSAGYRTLDLKRLPSNWDNRLPISILRYSHAFNLLGGGKYHELGPLFAEIQVDKSFSHITRNNMPHDSDRLVSLMLHGDFNECCAQLCSDILMHAVRLEIFVNLSDVAELSLIHVQDIDSIVRRLSDYDTGVGLRAQNSFTFIVQFVYELWIMSCCSFLCGYYDRTGHVLMSIKYLRQYCYHSEKVLKSIDPLRCNDCPGQHSMISLYQICCSHAFSFHLSARISDCYIRLSTLYAQLGDTHKSMRYSISSAEMLGVSSSNMKINRRTSITTFMDGFSYNSEITYRLRRTKRSCFKSLLLALPFASADEYILDFSKAGLNVICDETEKSEIDTDWMQETVKDLLILGDYFVRNKRTVDTDIFFSSAWSLSLLSRQQSSIINLNVDNFLLQVALKSHFQWSPTFWDMIFRVGQRLHQLDKGSTERFLALFGEVVSAPVASSLTRASALYHLGLHFLHQARASGELHHLWEGYTNRERSLSSCHSPSFQGNIVLAHDHFFHGSSLAGPTSSLLSRKMMRCLALVTGPKISRRILGYSASELLHSSIGCTARLQASRVFETQPILNELYTALDVPLQEEAFRHEAFQQLYTIGSKTLPSTWTFVAISLCPTGEVLVSAIHPSPSAESNRAFVHDIVCIFPPSEDEHAFGVFHDLLAPFNKLMERSNAQLSAKEETNPTGANNPSAKEIWWTERRSLDMELKRLLALMDEKLFNYTCVKEVLSPYSICDESFVEDDLRHVSGNLSMRFEAMCTVDEPDTCQSSCFKTEGPNSNMSSDLPIISSLWTDPTVFLVLDENFQSFPMENLPTFIESTVCRIPSIPFAVARCHCHNQSFENCPIASIDLRKTTYVLDPECNLAATRLRMHEFLEDLSSKYGSTWNGFVGKIPSNDVVEAAFSRGHSLYLFCGHGGGEIVLSRTKFDNKFLGRGVDHLPCQSALVLMGCSSGRLVSVNASKDEFAPYEEYQYEPDGAVISYLCAGAPCIVGNLWDVTDRDIDKYFKELLNLFTAGNNAAPDGNQSLNLAACVARARSAPKLRYIIGCAPVIYGIPVRGSPKSL